MVKVSSGKKRVDSRRQKYSLKLWQQRTVNVVAQKHLNQQTNQLMPESDTFQLQTNQLMADNEKRKENESKNVPVKV